MRLLTAYLMLGTFLCLLACDRPAKSGGTNLQQENARLRTVADSLEQQLAIARQEGSDIAYLKSRGLENPEEDLKRDLLQNRNIIPREGVLGGTMHFTEEGIQVMNRNWVLAYFEDGHNAGNALLTYTINNGKITWRVIHSELL
jgi:hypothetical protein